jgi:hypothetical protein
VSTAAEEIFGFQLSFRKKKKTISEICALLVYYAALGGNSVQKFRDNLSVASSSVKELLASFKMRPIGCPETSVKNYQTTLRNIPAVA